MSREQELQDRIAHLETQVQRIRDEIKAADEELAALLSPFQVDDIITWKVGTKTYRGRVVRIIPCRAFLSGARKKPDSWMVRRIRKDNSEGVLTTVHSFDHPTKVQGDDSA